MQYLRARYYEPGAGRMMTKDPIHDGLNWYIYCMNDPVNRVDPLGLMEVVLNKYAESHGAAVVWNEVYNVGGTTYVDATVTFHEKTTKVTAKFDYKGDLVIEDSILDSKYGWKLTLEDQWAEMWGETVNKVQAAKMLGISQTYVYGSIEKGALTTAPDGRVLVRQACRWANSANGDNDTICPSRYLGRTQKKIS